MASQIVLWDPTDLGDADGRLDYRYENTISTPVTAAEYIGWRSGQGIADTYELTFTVSGGVTAAVVCGADVKNPFQSASVAITADGATWNYVLPGWRFKVSSSVDTGHKAIFSNGAIMTAGGVTTDVLNRGVVEAGSTSTQKQIAAKNVGDADSVTTKIAAVPGFYWTPLSAVAFVYAILPHSDDTREHNAPSGTKAITFADWKDGTGAKTGFKTADIYVDGDLCVSDAMFDGSTRYEYGHADYDDANDYLQGQAIILENTTADPSAVTITLVTTDGHLWEELAPDNSGSPGTWVTGDLTLTESGQQSGTIRAGQSGKFWNRWAPPSSAEPSTIRVPKFIVRGLTV